MTSDTALLVAATAGYLAFLLWQLWPNYHDCHDDRCIRTHRKK